MNRLLLILSLTIVAGLVSCKRFTNPLANQEVLAEVGGEKLYLHDIIPIFTPNMTAEDSAKIQKSYVDQWVKDRLKIREAQELFHNSQEDIDQMVEEYRNSLMIHKVEQYYVDRLLDTLFTDQQITDYYLGHKPDFVLDKNLLKARVVKVPDGYRQISKFKEMMLSSGSDAYQDFVDICTKNGFELIEINNWTELPVLLSLLPTDTNTNYSYLLNKGKLFEFKQQGYTYYVRVTDHQGVGDYAPIESVSDVIQRVLFNQRKQDIIKAHEDSLYRQAVAEKKIVVNVN